MVKVESKRKSEREAVNELMKDFLVQSLRSACSAYISQSTHTLIFKAVQKAITHNDIDTEINKCAKKANLKKCQLEIFSLCFHCMQEKCGIIENFMNFVNT